jgi:ATP-dependent Clp protease adaptor protein ClpS
LSPGLSRIEPGLNPAWACRRVLCHDGGVSTASPAEVDPTLTPDEITFLAKPWVTIVWNDPVNLMSYVTYVFQTYFGYDKKKAERLMLEVHQDGKSVVSTGTREEMERDVQAMHEYGLWATMERAS